MSNVTSALARIALAVALAGLTSCAPLQNSPTDSTANGSATLGSSSGSASTPSSAGTVIGGTIDSSQSQGLSDYLKHHQLPLVGGQVVTSPSGGKQAILFGFVATDYGKTDAEQKARNYLKDPAMVVDNRIKVSPELANSKDGSTPNPAPSYSSPDSTDPYATGSVQDYQNNLPPDANAYQQQGRYQQQYQQYGGGYGGGSSSGLMMMMSLLGMFGGGGIGVGGGGGSYGGFSSGYSPYSSYGGGYPNYPSYPPPSAFGP